MINILIVDDHPIVRQGLALLINQESDMKVSAEADNSTDALKLARSEKFDLAILDISLETALSGLELIKQLKSEFPAIPMLALSMHDETVLAERALQAGALGYIMKHEGSEKLIEAIRNVSSGLVYVSGPIAGKILGQFAAGSTDTPKVGADLLTDREIEVFQLLGDGNSTREVAEKLHLSIKTIDAHRANIKAKLKLRNASELVQSAVRWVESLNLH